MLKSRPRTQIPRRIKFVDLAVLVGSSCFALLKYRIASCRSAVDMPDFGRNRAVALSLQSYGSEVFVSSIVLLMWRRAVPYFLPTTLVNPLGSLGQSKADRRPARGACRVSLIYSRKRLVCG